MRIYQDLTGLRVGRLLVQSRANTYPARNVMWSCLCECGTVVAVSASNLRRGGSRSCGCLRREVQHARFTKHGRCGTREYRSWLAAKQRCYGLNNKHYKDYGARGIVMSDEWREDFAAFLRDMGPCPAGLTLDRINNDGPYSAQNCRWADAATQALNKRQRRSAAYYLSQRNSHV